MSEEEQKAAVFAFLATTQVIEKMSESIHDGIWLFAKNGSALPLLTSDHPVCIKTSDSRMWVKGINQLIDGRYIVFPLSPNIVMYCKERAGWASLSRFDCTISPVILDEEMVQHENAGQAFAATRFIFSKRDDFEALREFIPSIGTDLYARDSTAESKDGVERTAKYLVSRARQRRRR